MSTTVAYDQAVASRANGGHLLLTTADCNENNNPNSAFTQDGINTIVDTFAAESRNDTAATISSSDGLVDLSQLPNPPTSTKAKTTAVEQAGHAIASSGRKMTNTSVFGPASSLGAMSDVERTKNAAKQCWMNWLQSFANRRSFVALLNGYQPTTMFKLQVDLNLLCEGIAQLVCLGNKSGVIKLMERKVQNNKFVGYSIRSDWNNLLPEFDFKLQFDRDTNFKWKDCVIVSDVREKNPSSSSSGCLMLLILQLICSKFLFSSTSRRPQQARHRGSNRQRIHRSS